MHIKHNVSVEINRKVVFRVVPASSCKNPLRRENLETKKIALNHACSSTKLQLIKQIISTLAVKEIQ